MDISMDISMDIHIHGKPALYRLALRAFAMIRPLWKFQDAELMNEVN